MDTIIREQLIQFYHQSGIHPSYFRCPHQNICRRFAHQGRMIEAKMSLVGSLYGVRYQVFLNPFESISKGSLDRIPILTGCP
jgi:hypothetical protein